MNDDFLYGKTDTDNKYLDNSAAHGAVRRRDRGAPVTRSRRLPGIGDLLSGPAAARMTAAAISLMLILNISLLSSWAWLTSRTDPVVNTFVFGDLSLTLTETDTDADGDPGTNIYPIRPGGIVAKDPVLSVTCENSGCWLFVKLTRSEGFDQYLEYSVADGWTDLDGRGVIYYRQVERKDGPQNFGVIANDTVSVKDSVTKEVLSELTENTYPTLTVTGYAVLDEQGLDTAADAWTVFGEE